MIKNFIFNLKKIKEIFFSFIFFIFLFNIINIDYTYSFFIKINDDIKKNNEKNELYNVKNKFSKINNEGKLNNLDNIKKDQIKKLIKTINGLEKNNFLKNYYIYNLYKLYELNLKRIVKKNNKDKINNKIDKIYIKDEAEKYFKIELNNIKKNILNDICNGKIRKNENIKALIYFKLLKEIYLIKFELKYKNNRFGLNFIRKIISNKELLGFIKAKIIKKEFGINKLFDYCYYNYVNLKSDKGFCNYFISSYFFDNITKNLPNILYIKPKEIDLVEKGKLNIKNIYKLKNRLFTNDGLLYFGNKNFQISSNFGYRNLFKNHSIHYGVDVASRTNNIYIDLKLNNYDNCYAGYDKLGYGNFILCTKGKLFFLMGHLKNLSYLFKLNKNNKIDYKNLLNDKSGLKGVIELKTTYGYYLLNGKLYRPEVGRIIDINKNIKENRKLNLYFNLYKISSKYGNNLLIKYGTTGKSTGNHIHIGIGYYDGNISLFNYSRIGYYIFR